MTNSRPPLHNWGDHPVVVLLVALAAIFTIAGTIWTFIYTTREKVKVVQQGPNKTVDKPEKTNPPERAGRTTTPAPSQSLPPPLEQARGFSHAAFHTTAGKFTVRLLQGSAPLHVSRFISLVREGFYDTVQFNRVVPGVLIEAGFRSDNPADGAYLKPELTDTQFKRGVLGMSTSGAPLRETWRFFVVTADAPFLNGNYTAFGEITEGMEVIDNIAAAQKSQWILAIDLS